MTRSLRDVRAALRRCQYDVWLCCSSAQGQHQLAWSVRFGREGGRNRAIVGPLHTNVWHVLGISVT